MILVLGISGGIGSGSRGRQKCCHRYQGERLFWRRSAPRNGCSARAGSCSCPTGRPQHATHATHRSLVPAPAAARRTAAAEHPVHHGRPARGPGGRPAPRHRRPAVLQPVRALVAAAGLPARHRCSDSSMPSAADDRSAAHRCAGLRNALVTESVLGVIDLFGVERCFFASDLPVDLKSGWPARVGSARSPAWSGRCRLRTGNGCSSATPCEPTESPSLMGSRRG